MSEPGAAVSDPPEVDARGGYDPARRRRAVRGGRQRGCSIYISAAELRKAGVDPDGPEPFYRVWGGRRGGLVIRLYGEP